MNLPRLNCLVGLILVLTCLGCQANVAPPTTAGSEAAARQHFQDEFQKWMAGEKNQVSTMESRLKNALAPISYNIRSIVKDSPDPLAFDSAKDLPPDWKDWPAYRVNVGVEFKSKAGTPVEKISTYRVTWNAAEAKWYIAERFE
ncbi:hypothetical protein [Anatilimnocola floriformis]|uniref:hypothetical protein n=1 Tax=Anatilimnocola floriformis TaxID=2948575 RepID=UPI0020C211D3|nr:hypothetical protein [Anatilimnocola floriformis]